MRFKIFIPLILLFFCFSFQSKSQVPQSLNNVQTINWMGSNQVGPCNWIINPQTQTISAPCLTGSFSGNAVTINGLAVPPNVNCISSNGSSQLVQGSQCSAFSLSAADFVTGAGNNGITNALNFCSVTYPLTCYLTIGPGYSGNDPSFIPNGSGTSPNGYNLDLGLSDTAVTSVVPSNTIIIDERKGKRTYLTNNWCALNFSNQCSADIEQSVQWSFQTGQLAPNYFVHQRKYTVLAGGQNYNNNAYSFIANYSPDLFIFNKYTAGQGIGKSEALISQGVGDTLHHSFSVVCYGGITGAPTDEGCINGDENVYQGAVQWASTALQTVNGPSGLLVAFPTQGQGTLGQERELLDQTTLAITGAVVTVSCPGGDTSVTTPCTLTTSTNLFTADAARGTVGTAMQPNTAITLTPTFTIGSAANFSTPQLACISDGYETERLYPTATSGATVSFVPTKPHLATAIITTGSTGCGKDFSFDADNVTSTNFPNIPNGSLQNPATPVGTLNRVWKIIGNPATNQIMVAFQGKGSYHAVSQNMLWTTTNNTFHVYQAATISAVSTTSGLNASLNGGTLGLYNNNMVVNFGDILTSPDSPTMLVGKGHINYSKLFPTLGNTAGGIGFNFNGVWNNGDCLLCLYNNTPETYYDTKLLTAPTGLHITGGELVPFWINQAVPSSTSPGATMLFGCVDLCNSSFSPFAVIQDSSTGVQGTGQEIWYFNQNTGEYRIGVNNKAFFYGLLKDGFEIPQLADSAVNVANTGMAKIWYSTTQNCVAYLLTTGAKQCLGTGSGSGNATSIQGNPVTAGTPSLNQVYSWNGSAFVLATIAPIVNGQGTTANANGTNKEIDVVNNIRTVSGTTDGPTIADCSATIVYTNTGAVTVNLPTANSPVGTFQEGCAIKFIDQGTGGTAGGLTINTVTSNIYNYNGTTGGTPTQTTVTPLTDITLDSHGGNWWNTKQPASSGSGTVTNFTAPSGSWPTWLTPTVTNASTTPNLAVAASAIPNAALANSSTTVNGVTCTLGTGCTIPGSSSYVVDNQSGASYTIPSTDCVATLNRTATVAMTDTLTPLAANCHLEIVNNGTSADQVGIAGTYVINNQSFTGGSYFLSAGQILILNSIGSGNYVGQTYFNATYLSSNYLNASNNLNMFGSLQFNGNTWITVPITQTVGTAIASAATIAPTASEFHITGTTGISTITAPTNCTGSTKGCVLTFITDSAVTFSAGSSTNQIKNALTTVAGGLYFAAFDNTTGLWYLK